MLHLPGQFPPLVMGFTGLSNGGIPTLNNHDVLNLIVLQKHPTLKLLNPALLHLPLVFPTQSSRPLTAWCTINLNLPSLLPNFSSASLTRENDSPSTASTGMGDSHQTLSQIPSGTYSHVSYVKVYATCRLRRVWFTEFGPSQTLPWEFELYSSG